MAQTQCQPPSEVVSVEKTHTYDLKPSKLRSNILHSLDKSTFHYWPNVLYNLYKLTHCHCDHIMNPHAKPKTHCSDQAFRCLSLI